MSSSGGDTAERLVEATREPLWERGRVGTSSRAIPQRTQAGQGSMYHHFGGKPALARAAVRRSAERVRARASGDPGAFQQAAEGLLGLLGAAPVRGATGGPPGPGAAAGTAVPVAVGTPASAATAAAAHGVPG
ncbi:TetR/AcrR family transcriptional regulator [Streptomyces iconiensis]|uniref:TetR/AcrR family transcriptional regulator n=1 Tax=Streptomyces iconiensis TaxID=1384038 RepID=UPI003D2F9422